MHIIFFDDECLICNKSVQFILKRDKKHKFYFATQKSNYYKGLIQNDNQFLLTIDSIVLKKGSSHLLVKCDAVLEILNVLYETRFFSLFKIVPSFVRDWFYDFVAKNRKKWFKESCLVLNESEKTRFLK